MGLLGLFNPDEGSNFLQLRVQRLECKIPKQGQRSSSEGLVSVLSPPGGHSGVFSWQHSTTTGLGGLKDHRSYQGSDLDGLQVRQVSSPCTLSGSYMATLEAGAPTFEDSPNQYPLVFSFARGVVLPHP